MPDGGSKKVNDLGRGGGVPHLNRTYISDDFRKYFAFRTPNTPPPNPSMVVRSQSTLRFGRFRAIRSRRLWTRGGVYQTDDVGQGAV